MTACKTYVLEVPSLNDSSILQLCSFITPSRALRIQRYRFDEDKLNSLFSELLLRYVLAKEYNLQLSDQNLVFEQNRKPYLSGNKQIHFNLSHSKNMVAVSIGNYECGIDIQMCDEISSDIFAKVCSPSELSFLNSLSSAEAKYNFCRLWTLKECFTKAIGLGFSIAPSKINFEITKENVLPIVYDGTTYFFKEYSLNNTYCLSTCSTNEKFSPEVNIIASDDVISFFNSKTK